MSHREHRLASKPACNVLKNANIASMHVCPGRTSGNGRLHSTGHRLRRDLLGGGRCDESGFSLHERDMSSLCRRL
jgi:hypothetical protein